MSQTALYLALPGDNLDALFSNFKTVLQKHPLNTIFIAPTSRIAQMLQRRLADEGVSYTPSSITTLRGLARTLFEDHATMESFLSDVEAKLILSHLLAVNRERLPLFFSRGAPSPRLVNDLQILLSVLIARKVQYPDCLGNLQSQKSEQIKLFYDAYTDYLEKNRLVDKDTILQWAIHWLDAHPAFQLHSIFVYGLFEPLPLEREFIVALQRHATTCVYTLPAGGDARIFQDDGSWLHPDSTLSINPSSAVCTDISRIFSPNQPFDASAPIVVGTHKDRISEVRSIAEEIRALIDSGVSPGEIAVAFPDLSRGVSLTASIFTDFGIPFDAASGELLAESRVIQTVFQLLAVPAFDYQREHVVAILNSPYVSYTWDHQGHSAHLSASEVDAESRNARIIRGKESWTLRLDARIRAARGEIPSENAPAGPRSHPEQLDALECLRDGIRHLFEELKILEGTKSIDGHISALRFLLQRLRYPDAVSSNDDDVRAQEYRDISQFASVLDTLERFYGTHQPLKLSLADFFVLLSTLISDTRSAPARNPHAVQVLGIRELVHTSFAYTFIADLVEGEMPRLTTRLPFTNEQEIRQMGTRTREDILREERFYFISALLSGKKGVYLSSAESDGDKVLLSSRFLVDLLSAGTVRPWEPAPQRHSLLDADTRLGGHLLQRAGAVLHPHRNLLDIVYRTNIENYHRRGEYDSCFDGVLSEDSAVCAELEQQFDQRRIYSPTMLESYAVCPFLFYLQRILHLEPFQDIEPELTAKERGSLLHEIAFRFFTEWRSSGNGTITEAHLPQALEQMSRVAQGSMDRYPFDGPVWDVTREDFLGRNGMGPGLLERLLRHEIETGASPFRPTYFEFSFGLPMAAGACDASSIADPIRLELGVDPSDAIQIRGKIDRVDTAEDGSFIILDYKTGSTYPRFKDIQGGMSFQLPLYISALERVTKLRGVGGFYYTVKQKEIKKYAAIWDATCAYAFTPFSRDKACTSEDFRQILTGSLTHARRHITNIRRGLFHPAAEVDLCPGYCEYKTVCRFDPLRRLELQREGGTDAAH